MHTLTDRSSASGTATLALRPAHRPDEPYADAHDRSRHLDEMQRLAQETDCPLQVVQPIYEATLMRLKAEATIQDYLPILVAKGVKSVLKDLARHH